MQSEQRSTRDLFDLLIEMPSDQEREDWMETHCADEGQKSAVTELLRAHAVSYTHLTLPTTPYV